MKTNIEAYLSIAGETARKQYAKDRREAVKAAAQNQGLREFLAACRNTPLAKTNAVFASELSALASARLADLESERLSRIAKREAAAKARYDEQMRILKILGRETYAAVYGFSTLEKLDKLAAMRLVAGRNDARERAAKEQQARDEALVEAVLAAREAA